MISGSFLVPWRSQRGVPEGTLGYLAGIWRYLRVPGMYLEVPTTCLGQMSWPGDHSEKFSFDSDENCENKMLEKGSPGWGH